MVLCTGSCACMANITVPAGNHGELSDKSLPTAVRTAVSKISSSYALHYYVTAKFNTCFRPRDCTGIATPTADWLCLAADHTLKSSEEADEQR